MFNNIFWRGLNTGTFRNGRIRLYIDFSTAKDGGDIVGEWTPTWDQVFALVRALVEVERKNCEESEYTEKMGQLFASISSRLRSAASARTITGRLTHYYLDAGEAIAVIEAGEMTIRGFVPTSSEELVLGLPLSDAEVRDMVLDRALYAWVEWNGFVIRRTPITPPKGRPPRSTRQAPATYQLAPS